MLSHRSHLSRMHFMPCPRIAISECPSNCVRNSKNAKEPHTLMLCNNDQRYAQLLKHRLTRECITSKIEHRLAGRALAFCLAVGYKEVFASLEG